MVTTPDTTTSGGDPTRERLLDSAERLFARHGFAATSVRDLTREADCNLASVNYHFGSKQNLYEQMFARLLEQLRRQREAALSDGLARPGVTLEDFLRCYAEVFLDLLAEDAALCRMRLALFMREMTEPHLPPGLMYERMIGPTKQVLGEAFARFCPDLDRTASDLCIHSMVGQLLHVLHARAMLEHAGVTDAPILDANRAVDHIVQFSAAGMKALARKGRRR